MNHPAATVEHEVIVGAPSREKVERLEALILQTPQVDLKTTHCLSGGIYARTIIIPAGTILTGAAHKKDLSTSCKEISLYQQMKV